MIYCKDEKFGHNIGHVSCLIRSRGSTQSTLYVRGDIMTIKRKLCKADRDNHSLKEIFYTDTKKPIIGYMFAKKEFNTEETIRIKAK